ncbi:heteromeric transposase endonuclease subunit TnsA [Moraxella catarrhalis]|uniref:TnsA endonuclease N-terminal domain-containing protein n=1 Tax=Moraxella catarrhalis TaxID=480 RepID=UPI00128CF9C5|nr:TnsA endonuclease N-terminal domain-containing protein [Moraxella catarrhalis]MPX19314.1 heteromeric transposase endonuclease subunit TnsA [Moraxella catarrhalis]
MPITDQKKYKPYIKVNDISSIGRSHRVFGHKTGRSHHLFSDLELAVFLLFEWNENVLEINEQIELNLDETLLIANEAGIKHPTKDGNNKVMTSDFYITFYKSNRPSIAQLAIQAKYSKDLEDIRTIEKIELERRFWKKKEIDFCIVTELDIPKTVLNNIKWLYPAKNSNLTHLSFDLFEYYANQLSNYENLTLIEFCKKCDMANNNDIGTSLSQIKALLTCNYMSFDIRKDYKKILCLDIVPVKEQYHNCIIEEMKVA